MAIECGVVKSVSESKLVVEVDRRDGQWSGETDDEYAVREAKYAPPTEPLKPGEHPAAGAAGGPHVFDVEFALEQATTYSPDKDISVGDAVRVRFDSTKRAIAQHVDVNKRG